VTAEITTIPVSGEIVLNAESPATDKLAALKANETIIKRNWKAATEKANNVYRSLTLIHTYDLWKMHKDAAGKRKYSSFEKYLFGEFGWELSRVRALQVIKQTRSAMIEAGELPAETGTTRKRTAPEVTSERAAKVTADQLEKALDAFRTRCASIDAGDPDKGTIENVLADIEPVLATAIDALRDFVASAAAEAEGDEDDDDDDDDEDEDEDESDN
jgi:hypothetical protein